MQRDSTYSSQLPTTELNHPDLWQQSFPVLPQDSHKYDRGHALIFGGNIAQSGAAMLAGEAALRIGAGLVTQIVPDSATLVYAIASKKAIMTRDRSRAEALLTDERVTAQLIGPGFGVGADCCELVEQLLRARPTLSTVLDADALTSFADDPAALFTLIHEQVIFTPHAGEFARLFPDLGNLPSRAEAAYEAAKRSGAILVLKGATTIIASPHGRVVTHHANAPQLATAGSGDVLAGIITGLAAQRMPLFEAACAAVWLHEAAARHFGIGLIADDLPDQLPAALNTLFLRATD